MATSLQIAVYIVTWSSFTLGIGSCVLRVYCCVRILRKWRADDYMNVVNAAILMGALGMWQSALLLGCGGKEPNRCNYFAADGKLIKYFYAMSVYYSVMHFAIKGTFLVFFLRLSPNRTFWLWTGIGLGLNVGMVMINIFFIVFQCVPISAAWKPLARINAQCINPQFILYGPGAVNTLLDFYVFLLPIPTLWNLQMPFRRKIAVISVFAFGGAAVIMGLIRFHSLRGMQSLFDTSRSIGEIIIVAALELNLAVIAVNLPAIRSIWIKRSSNQSTSRSLPRIQTNSRKSNTASKNSNRTLEPLELENFSKITMNSPVSTESQVGLWEGVEAQGNHQVGK